MIGMLILGLILGALLMYFGIMAIPQPEIDWRETVLLKLTCCVCGKLVAPVEFTLHGGLCEGCFKERHGYNHSSTLKTGEKQ